MMKNKIWKRTAVGSLALTLVVAASPVQNGIGGTLCCKAIEAETEETVDTVEAVKTESPYWDVDTQTLHLSGSNWTKNDSVFSVYREQALNIVADEGTVLPRDCAELFKDCIQVQSIDLSKADSSNVVYARAMFCNCYSLASLDLSNFNTSNVTNMNAMFENCSSLEALDLSSFDTKNVINMNGMFKECLLLTSLDLSMFDTSNVTDMFCMFRCCKGLTSIDISSFDTSNVESMNSMFYYCVALNVLDLGSFDISSVSNMNYMFNGCNDLKTIKVSELWNAENVNYSNGMFGGCNNIVGCEGTIYDLCHTDKEYARVDTDQLPGYFKSTVHYKKYDAKEPTCTEDGNIKYYTLPDGGLYIDEKGTPLDDRNGDGYVDINDTIIKKTGHSYSEPEWYWADDYESAYAVFTCERCGDTQKSDAEINIQNTQPTYNSDGEIEYSATIIFNDKEYNDVKKVTMPKLEKKDISNAEIIFKNGDTLIENDDEQIISYDVVLNGETLTKDVDYELYEGDDVASEPGVYYVKIKAIGNEFVGEKTFTWSIVPSELSVTVNGEPIEQEVIYGNSVTVTAPEADEGMKFSHWEENGEIVSYSKSYSFIAMESVALIPVYVNEDEIVEKQPILKIHAYQTSYNREKAIKYQFSHDVPGSYTIEEVGLLYATNKLAGADTSVEGYAFKDLTNEEEALSVGVIDVENVIKNNTTGKIKCYIANYKYHDGTVIFSYSIGENTECYTYAIGYVKTINAYGDEEILYSNLIAADYNGINN